MDAKTTSTAPPSSPQATAGTASADVSPAAPLLLRTAANPGLDRSRDQRPSSPVSSALTGSRDQRPSSPVSSALIAPPPHMRAIAPFWDTTPADVKRQMLQVSFQDVEQGIQDAKVEAAARVTQLADAEHCRAHVKLVDTKSAVTTALHGTRAELASLQRSIKECKTRVAALVVQERTAAAAVATS